MNIHIYTPQVVEWYLPEGDNFNGLNQASSLFEVGLTPPDPDRPSFSYFNVFPIIEIVNDEKLKFRGKARIVFGLQAPIAATPVFLFECVLKAHELWLGLFNERAKGTSLVNKFPPNPTFNQLEQDLLAAIHSAYS